MPTTGHAPHKYELCLSYHDIISLIAKNNSYGFLFFCLPNEGSRAISSAMTDPWFTFPIIDPVAISIGPLAIRWYALAYMAGLIGGWQILKRIARSQTSPVHPHQFDQLLNYVLFGVILGGRFGYVLFYKPLAYLSDPLAIFRLWEGGMAFHGGFIGVIVAVWLFAYRHKLHHLALGDMIALVAPLGLFFGRIANFINGELYGRVTSHPIGMIFPHAGTEPRHPSQLYEAGLEGLVLGLVLWGAWRAGLAQKYKGSLIALFLIGYGTARFIVEFYREADAHIGLYHWGGFALSQGQLLSMPMVAIGGGLLVYCLRRPAS